MATECSRLQADTWCVFLGEPGEAEPVEGSRVPGADSDLMDGETEADTVVIAGQPEVLSTQAMQVHNTTLSHTLLYWV
jgi:hypothetical protein